MGPEPRNGRHFARPHEVENKGQTLKQDMVLNLKLEHAFGGMKDVTLVDPLP